MFPRATFTLTSEDTAIRNECADRAQHLRLEVLLIATYTGFLEDLSLLNTTKLDPALLSFRISYTILIPQISARKLSWTAS